MIRSFADDATEDLFYGRRTKAARKRGVTPSTALRLSEFFGTSVGFWMNLQTRLDLYDAMQDEKEALRQIRKRRPPRSKKLASVAS